MDIEASTAVRWPSRATLELCLKLSAGGRSFAVVGKQSGTVWAAGAAQHAVKAGQKALVSRHTGPRSQLRIRDKLRPKQDDFFAPDVLDWFDMN